MFFFKKNKTLIQQLEQLNPSCKYEHIWCSFYLIKNIETKFYANIYFIENAIVITEDFLLDYNKNNKKYCETYIVFKETTKPSINISLFRSTCKLKKWDTSVNGKMIIKVDLYQQSPFKQVGFIQKSRNMTIEFNLPLKEEELSSLIKKSFNHKD